MKRLMKKSFTGILILAIFNLISFSAYANWQEEWNDGQAGISAFEKADSHELGCKCKDKKKKKSEE